MGTGRVGDVGGRDGVVVTEDCMPTHSRRFLS